MKLAEALEGCSLGLLREIAVRHGLQIEPGTLRREIAQRLHTRLLESGVAAQLAREAPSPARHALALMDSAHGCYPGARLRRQLAVGSPGVGEAAAGLRWLVEHGLAYRQFRPEGAERGEWLCVPEELAPLLTPNLPDLPEAPAALAVETTASGQADPLLDLITLADASRRHDGRLSRELLDTLPLSGETTPGRASDERWRFLARLALRLRWLSRDERRVAPTERLEAALREPARAHARLCATFLDAADPGPHRADATAATSAHPAPRRLSDALLELGDGWRNLRSVIAWQQARSRVLVNMVGAAPESDQPGAHPDPEWSDLLLEPFAWLGLVTMAKAEGAIALTVSEPGRLLLAGSEADVDAPILLAIEGGPVAMVTRDLGALLRLAAYLERESARVWRLTRMSFAGGLRSGGSAKEATRFLERLAPEAGDAWRGRLAEWDAAARSASLKAAWLLELDEDAGLGEVLADPVLAACLESRLGRRGALVRDERLSELRSRLEELGIMLEAPGEQPSARGSGASLTRAELARVAALIERLVGRQPALARQADVRHLRERLSRLVGERAISEAGRGFGRRPTRGTRVSGSKRKA